jgi:hypothetical protein
MVKAIQVMDVTTNLILQKPPCLLGCITGIGHDKTILAKFFYVNAIWSRYVLQKIRMLTTHYFSQSFQSLLK